VACSAEEVAGVEPRSLATKGCMIGNEQKKATKARERLWPFVTY
jgi:hypothetical protein